MSISATTLVLRAAKRIPLKEVACVTTLILLVAGLWCKVYHMNGLASWNTPRVYGGDSWLGLATIKAYRDGEITPWAFQTVGSLDAPFGANWNDFPTSEKMLPYSVGIAARFIGLMPAFNLAALMAAVLAALSFYITCRILHYQWMFAFMGAVLFAFSCDMSGRLLSHLSLAYYWHIPFCLLVTWWCLDSRELSIGSSRWWFAAVVGAATGLQAIYYAFIFWQFLGFAMLKQALRRNKPKTISVIAIVAISVGCTLLMAAPHVLYRIQHGANSFVVQRSLGNLQVYALQLPELFLPPYHRWKAFFNFAQANYYGVSVIGGEMWGPYLGLVGIAGFVWLMGFGVIRLLDGRAQRIPVMFWQSLWIIVFSLVGGINLLLGVSGLQLFRATNRFSIVLLCLSLFFLVKQLGRKCLPGIRPVFALPLLLVGLWDTLPVINRDLIGYYRKIVIADKDFVKHLENKVPAGTMLFELPVMEFPEVAPRFRVSDYLLFRPYFYSRTLRFSYGADKGRPRESWQHDVENLPPSEMAETLERYGFGAILIDRGGYSDGAVSILKDLQASGRKVIEQDETGEFVAVGLQPRRPMEAPEIPPFPGPGFYGWEGDWRNGGYSWSQGNATLILTNSAAKPIDKRYTFVLGSLSKRSVTVLTPGAAKVVDLEPGRPQIVGPFALRLAPGETQIRFDTDSPAVPAGGADTRMLAFSVALRPAPSEEPVPVLGPGFFGFEGDWRKGAHAWSGGTATLLLDNSTSHQIEQRYNFILDTTSARHVTVITPVETKTVALDPGKPLKVGPFDLRLEPGQTPIRFETDQPAVLAGSGDPRKIAFSLVVVPHAAAASAN